MNFRPPFLIMDKIKLALDWTPNINHIGFFVAQQKSFYAKESLEIDLLSPAEDDYSITPAKKVELGSADFALCPMESILSYRTKAKPFKLKAVAAIYQEDMSAIVCTKASGIISPKELDGKLYASYQARYEDELVKQMIINDGGKGAIKIAYPRKLGIWETLLNGDFDSTWVFINWEGVQAMGKDVELISFKMSDFGIPYSYSPVIATSEEQIKQHPEVCKKFLQATKQGFLFAAKNIMEAAGLLSEFTSEADSAIDIQAAIKVSGHAFGSESNWGKMTHANVERYLDWIYEKNLETLHVSVDDLISNNLLSDQ